MPQYKFRAISPSGALTEGVQTTETRDALVSQLNAEGYIVLSVEGQETRRSGKLFDRWKRTRKYVNSFTEEMAVFLNSGFNLEVSLDLLLEYMEEGFREVVEEIAKKIREGYSLAEALEEFPEYFSPYYIGMVRAGEEAGNLPEVFAILADYNERTATTRSELFSALIYPCLLCLVGVVSVLVLIYFVIPKFSTIFLEMGATMPFSTRMVIKISHLVAYYGWMAAAACLIAGIYFKNRYRDACFRLKVDEKKFSLPVVGQILTSLEVSRFTRALGSLLNGGVDLMRSLNILRGMEKNFYMKEIVETAAANVKEGKGLSSALKGTKVFSGKYIEMVRVGEQTGKLGEMLIKASNMAERDLRERLKRAVALVEPGVILVMGLIIGVFVVSMLMAIFGINDLVF